MTTTTPRRRHTRARRLNRAAILLLLPAAAVLPVKAVERIQNDLFHPGTIALTLLAAAALLALVWCIDRAHR